MTFRASVQSSLVGLVFLHRCSKPTACDIENAEGVVNEVNDSSGSRRIFKTNGFGRCFAPSCFAWFLLIRSSFAYPEC